MKFAPHSELGRHLGGNVIREFVDQTQPAGQSDRMTDKQHNVVQATTKAAERMADLAGPKIPAASDSDKAKKDHRIEGRTGEDRRPLFVTIEPADCREFLPTIEANSIHLTVTDPPYYPDVIWQIKSGCSLQYHQPSAHGATECSCSQQPFLIFHF